MEDEIPFIRNIEDYENYKKLRPTKIYQRKKYDLFVVLVKMNL